MIVSWIAGVSLAAESWLKNFFLGKKYVMIFKKKSQNFRWLSQTKKWLRISRCKVARLLNIWLKNLKSIRVFLSKLKVNTLFFMFSSWTKRSLERLRLPISRKVYDVKLITLIMSLCYSCFYYHSVFCLFLLANQFPTFPLSTAISKV